jgi:RNA-directed DNA polymerase
VQAIDSFVTLETLRDALSRELTAPPRLLPPNQIGDALHAHLDEIAEWTLSRVSGGWTPSSEQVVAVAKGQHGVRPVAIWDLPSRLAYSAMVAGISSFIPMPERSATAWTYFLEHPLTADCSYIVTADIASCYQLIDHGELEQELLIQTGQNGSVKAIVGLLREVSGRTYGIPQQSEASDVIAEAFLARLERSVVRKGVICSRYSDDFRITCQDWSSTVHAIETLSEQSRRMGLVLNDSKALTFKKRTYERHLTRAAELREEIASAASVDLTELYIDYDGDIEIVRPAELDVELLSAVRLLERWKQVAGRGHVAERNRQEHVALVRLLPLALRALQSASADAENALSIALQLLRFEQKLTPQVCRFLATRTDYSAVIEALDLFLAKAPYLTAWQTWWLSQVVAGLPGFAVGTDRFARRRREWLENAHGQTIDNQILRAHTALALARCQLIGEADLLALYDRSGDVARPTVVAAIAAVKPSASTRKAITEDSKLHSWIYDWSASSV